MDVDLEGEQRVRRRGPIMTSGLLVVDGTQN